MKIKELINDIKNIKEYKNTIERQDREYDVIRTYNAMLEQELKFVTEQKDHYLSTIAKKNAKIKKLTSKIKELERGGE